MKTLQFPMTLTHRSNPHAQVVVANADQLAEIPAEYLPETTGGTPDVVTAAVAIPGVNLDVGTSTAVDVAEDTERRQSLAEAVDEFTAHVLTEENRLAAIREEIERDRRELSQQVAALNDREQALANERAEFDAQRATATSTAAATGDAAGDTGAASSVAEGAATGETPAAPAKRTRATKEGA